MHLRRFMSELFVVEYPAVVGWQKCHEMKTPKSHLTEMYRPYETVTNFQQTTTVIGVVLILRKLSFFVADFL